MLRLLAVEDDPEHLPWLTSLLTKLGPQMPCETVHISSAWKEATSFLEDRADEIDVVITDLQDKQTKAFEGFNIIRLAKQKAKGVIAVSSFLDDPGHMRDVLRSGADFYVKKPFKPEWREWEEYRDELGRSAELSLYFALRQLSAEHSQDGNGRADVFLSYAHRDEELAHEIAEALGDAGLSCFMAGRDIQAGEEWEPRIRRGIASSAAVVLLITPESYKRPWVLCEAGAAWGNQKPIFPALAHVDITELPELIQKLQVQNIETLRGREALVEVVKDQVTKRA